MERSEIRAKWRRAARKVSLLMVASTSYTRGEQYLLGVTNEDLDKGEIHESLNRKLSLRTKFEPFQSTFMPTEMRCLSLVAHNHMKPAMKVFIEERKELLKKFRLTLLQSPCFF